MLARNCLQDSFNVTDITQNYKCMALNIRDTPVFVHMLFKSWIKTFDPFKSNISLHV